MLEKMIEHTEIYYKETLECETLVIAEILNPFLCLSFFLTVFGEKCYEIDEVTSLFKQIFDARKLKLSTTKEPFHVDRVTSPKQANGNPTWVHAQCRPTGPDLKTDKFHN